VNSRELKNEAMAWLRFVKRFPIVATEVGNWKADVLGLDEKTSTEVEVKVSKSDLKAEFRNKGAKHYVYGNVGTGFVPTYFYLFVPEYMREQALEVAGTANPKYGVAIYHPESGNMPGQKTEIARRASKLVERPPSTRLVKAATARMSSELCGLHRALYELSERVNGVVDLVTTEAARLAELSPEPDIIEENA